MSGNALLSASPKKVGVGSVCKNFKNGYQCAKEPCVFAHKCSKCGSGTHGATNCRTAPRGVAFGRDGGRPGEENHPEVLAQRHFQRRAERPREGARHASGLQASRVP